MHIKNPVGDFSPTGFVEQPIYQAFMTGYSNGAIEGTNNLIKVIKRVAYGYRNFENMKLRIKIIKGCFFTPVNRKSL